MEKKTMGVENAVDRKAIETGVAALSSRLSGSVAIQPILITLTDTGEQCCIHGAARSLRAENARDASPPSVRVSGPSRIINDILDGSMEASAAYASGRIRVRGDLQYLEGLLSDMGLLDCGQ